MRSKKKEKKDEIEILKNQLARALADYDNLQKRVEKQKSLLEMTLNLRLISKLLAVLDMLEEVQVHLEDPGLGITITEFKRILADEGVTQLKVKKGDEFDENKHDAIEKVSTKDKKLKGKVAEVTTTGWEKNGEIIIRPAVVKVYG